MQSPISRSDFAKAMALFAPFEKRPHIAVALSGGADSMALVLLMRDWLENHDGRLTALTVDHRLRPDSTAETAETGALMQSLGIPWQQLPWTDGPEKRNQPGLQALARKARYRLLNDWCRKQDILHLAVAHHLDDQQETRQMQKRRNHPAANGMTPEWFGLPCHCPDIRILRPLLAFPRAATEATCKAHKVTWIDDPSNQLTRFERVSIRQNGKQCDSQQQAQVHQTGNKLPDLLSWHFSAAGFAKLPVRELPRIGVTELRHVLRMVANADFAPSFEQSQIALSSLQHGKDHCLHNCRLIFRRHHLWIAAENHVAVSGFNNPEYGHLQRLGHNGLAKLPARLPSWLADLPPTIIDSLPAIYDGDQCIAIPSFDHLPGVWITPNIQAQQSLPQARFCPKYPASGQYPVKNDQ